MADSSPCLLKIITGPHRGGQVELRPGVRVGKEPLEGSPRKLLPYQMVTVGSTIFAVRPASGSWPAASAPMPTAPPALTEPPASETEGKSLDSPAANAKRRLAALRNSEIRRLLWVGLRNGRKWFSQSRLPDGSVIQQVLPTRVVVAKDGSRREVGLGEPLWRTKQ